MGDICNGVNNKKKNFSCAGYFISVALTALQGVGTGCSPELVPCSHPDSSRCSAPRVVPRRQEAVRPASERGSWEKAPRSASEG